MDLNKIIVQEFKKIEEEGYVEKVVGEQLKNTVDNVVKELFGPYGDFSKRIEKHVKENLNLNLDRIDLTSYNVIVLDAIQKRLDEATHVLGVEKINKALDEMLAAPEKEVKLTKLVEDMKKHEREWNEDDAEGEVTVIVESGSTLSFIYLDPAGDQRKYDCKYRLSVSGKSGEITSVSIEQKSFDKNVLMGGLYGFDETLFRLYAHGTKLIVDHDEVDLEYPPRYDWD